MLVSVAKSTSTSTTPGGSGGGCAEDTCPTQSSSLLQAKKLAVHGAEDPLNRRAHVWRSEQRAGPALEYFRWWGAGKVDHSLATTLPGMDVEPDGEFSLAEAVVDEAATAELTQRGLVRALESYRGPCAESESWALHQGVTDERGVQHALLHSPGGKLQYVAAHSGRVLVADPQACSGHPAMIQEEPVPVTGNEQLLDSNTDPLVQDCVKLFHRTVKENCNKDFSINVLTAHLQVINGFAVFVKLELTAVDGTVLYHEPECEFQIPESPDASLLQDQELPEEETGLIATLRMDIPICLADKESSVSPAVASVMELMKQRRFGHLPGHKGYEHLDYGEAVVLPQVTDMPTDYDLRETYPMCYPDGGKEVVRDQGNCGSCWAFAGASALMANLCASGKGQDALFSATDRLEVSVQGIMSCNYNGYGCKAGNWGGIDSALKRSGIAKERDFKYQCRYYCGSAPWGATCSLTANPRWHYDGVTMVKGEEGMLRALVLGVGAHMVSIEIHLSFFQYRSGVLSESTGFLMGSHAVTNLGFGVEDGQKYWLVQNSWGTNWGQGGFAKVVRGVGFMGIEDRGTIIKGYVDGGSKIPCADAEYAGFSTCCTKGKTIRVTCADAKWYCTESKYNRFAATVTKNCPATCNTAFCGATAPTAAERTAITTTTTYTSTTADNGWGRRRSSRHRRRRYQPTTTTPTTTPTTTTSTTTTTTTTTTTAPAAPPTTTTSEGSRSMYESMYEADTGTFEAPTTSTTSTSEGSGSMYGSMYEADTQHDGDSALAD